MGGATPATDSLNSLVAWQVLFSVSSRPILLLQLGRMIGNSVGHYLAWMESSLCCWGCCKLQCGHD